MTPDVLGAIVAAARRSARERERAGPRADFQRRVERARPRADAFVAALRGPGVRVIAECKRRSPSKGVLRAKYQPAEIAKAYEDAGAAAISVLTEPAFFDGHLDHLAAVRGAVGLPILRKDFITSTFEVAEARAAGADAVLLIVAALSDPDLQRLLAAAREHGLATLVEVHDREELARALAAGAHLVGVNSRSLKTLEVDVSVFEALAAQLPADVTAVAESGLRSADDLRRLSDLRYDAFLVGERLMTAEDPAQALRALLAPPNGGTPR